MRIIIKKILVFLIVFGFSFTSVIGAFLIWPPGEAPSVAGIYDKVGSSDFMIWEPDGSAYSTRGEDQYIGTWEQINATTVIANYEGAPPNLTYTITDDGVSWRDVKYIKRPVS